MSFLALTAKFKSIWSPGEQPGFFMVQSNGHNASLWLATHLNEHPDIICSHGASGAEYNFGFRQFKEGISEEIRLHRRQQSIDRKREMGLAEILDELRGLGEAKAYGNVHMFTLGEIVNKLRTSNRRMRNSVRCLNIIRHPVSYMSTLQTNVDGPETGSNKSLIDEIWLHASDYVSEPEWMGSLPPEEQLKASWKNAYFLRSLVWCRNLAREHGMYGDVKLITMERMTTDPDYLSELLDFLIGPGVIDDRYVDRMIASGPVNPHRSKGQARAGDPFSPSDDYVRWPAWQKAAFIKMYEKYEFEKLYAELGYDFSFIHE